jgi:hypothetical protein
MDQGLTWSRLSIESNGEFYTSVRAAPSNPQRLYVGAWWFRPAATEALYVSDDNGDHFTRSDLSAVMPMAALADGGMAPARGSFYVYAVDPTSPDTLWAGLQQDDDPRHSFALRSTDTGAHWQMMFDTPDQLTGVVLSDDGQTVWVATTGRLYRSIGGAPFERLDSPTRQTCVTRYGGRLYACGWPEFDGFAIARAVGSQPMQPLLTWPQVVGTVACPATSKVTTVCEGFFPAGDPDAGTGGGDGGPQKPPPPPSCHCGASGEEVSLTLLLAVGRFVLVHAHRRRRIHR